jgi:RNA polymerase sigma factor (sigma-70 family)
MDTTRDADALEDVFAHHRPRLQRLAQRILGDAHIAEDLVQDAWLRTMESTDGRPPVRDPLFYVHRVVRNLALDRLRRGSLEARLFEPCPDDQDGGVAGADFADGRTPESLAMHRQQLALLARAVAQLPERMRRAFELYRIEGRTQREIGAQLGVSAATVNQWIRAALHRCQAALPGS